MEQLAKAGHARQTFWLEMALAIGAIGWGVYSLTWFRPLLVVKGMPDGHGWSVESIWGGVAMLIGLGQCTTYWYGPSRIFTAAGAVFWGLVALVFSMTNTHALSNYNYAAVSLAHAAILVRLCRTWLLTGWAAALDSFRLMAEGGGDNGR